MTGTARPIKTGKKDSLGRAISVSGNAAEARATAPAPQGAVIAADSSGLVPGDRVELTAIGWEGRAGVLTRRSEDVMGRRCLDKLTVRVEGTSTELQFDADEVVPAGAALPPGRDGGESRAAKKARDYKAVAPFYDAYDAVYRQMEADGQYPYNASFEGKIPGLVGVIEKDDKVFGSDEHQAIVILQSMRHQREMFAEVDAFVAEGAEPIGTLDGATRYAKVMCYSFYVGGSGVEVHENVRVMPDDQGRPHWVLPKGRSTNGKLLRGNVIGLR